MFCLQITRVSIKQVGELSNGSEKDQKGIRKVSYQFEPQYAVHATYKSINVRGIHRTENLNKCIFDLNVGFLFENKILWII